jgi:protein arginine kinase
MMDQVSRAYALLTHSYQIEEIEALNALSVLKLGVDLEWVKGVTTEALNALFFSCRRSHLLTHFKEEIKQEELAHKRAEFIHKTINKASLIDSFT